MTWCGHVGLLRVAEFRNPCKFWLDILKGGDLFEGASILIAQYPIASKRNMVCGWTWIDLFGSEYILILSSSEHNNKISSIIRVGKIVLSRANRNFLRRTLCHLTLQYFAQSKPALFIIKSVLHNLVTSLRFWTSIRY